MTKGSVESVVQWNRISMPQELPNSLAPSVVPFANFQPRRAWRMVRVYLEEGEIASRVTRVSPPKTFPTMCSSQGHLPPEASR